MSLDPIVLLFQPNPDLDLRMGAATRAAQLGNHGFEVETCADIPELHQLAEKSLKSGKTILVVLDGPLADNCAAAACLRVLHPGIGIMAFTVSTHEDQLVQMLRSGADGHCPKNASATLLVATLFSLLRRLDYVPESLKTASPIPAYQGSWSLHEQAWALASPTGKPIPLTTGERAFMLTLCSTPALRATHADLLAAVDASHDPESPATSQGRLGVLVSRMRQKFQRHGALLPLKSIHGWGYMFAGTLK